MSFFKDKVVVITGGSDGIGKALIEALIPQGAKVATCGRNHDKIYKLQVEYANVLLHAVACDVSNEFECRRFIESTIETFGSIDILINNAGISMRALFLDSVTEVTRKVMEINFLGAVYCTKYALPSILERKGSVVGISSIAGYRGLPGRSAYSASKFALQGWLESIRTELLHSGVHVMWACPGFVASNIRHAALDDKGQALGASVLNEGKLMTAEECARHILRAIEKRKRTLVLTFQGKVTVLLNKIFPSLADRLTYNHYYKNGEFVK
ncbi:SDR family oxidoreductase [Flavitalea sp. BT771]|uniref:SDR family oxidoreductase n=1 Tax=Flavitalea sp. BT771 TaxID=3063329 RepID=UPI0026E31823|nr:SDR family oxidoreductase [Flavitalea sp. BT771]MDO6435432.1 SDR family oxidoreductase [Flavitalea sp. BT771]MDV6224208.1 SDR family oxidoreductase [Flavitalea sp. BT771]